jgi:O-antigen ligase
MTDLCPTSAVPNRKLLYALAAIPFFDCIFNQLNNAFQISFGGLSLLQVLRGYAVVIFIAISLWSVLRDRSGVARIPWPAAAALLLIGVFITKELVATGTMAMASIGAYGQMAYWVMFWITVSLLCQEPEQAEIILRGLAVGATPTALSVMLGFVFGGLNYYEDDAVNSSAGWFDTAKMITGVLVTGGLVLLYLGRKKSGWLYSLLASFCFLACVLTYARAGWVALAAVILWLPVWAVLFSRRNEWRWVKRFLVLALAAGLLVPAVVNTDKLFARWNDVQDEDKAGSGRATFWKVAVNGYIDGTPAQQALGYGYSAMSDMLFLNYGADIKHTHNDMLDMMLVGGVPGACWLLFLIGTLGWRICRTSIRSVEGGAGVAILLAYLFHGQFTGQLWGTDAMSYYMLSLASLYTIGRHHVSPANMPARPAIEEFASGFARA